MAEETQEEQKQEENQEQEAQEEQPEAAQANEDSALEAELEDEERLPKSIKIDNGLTIQHFYQDDIQKKLKEAVDQIESQYKS